MTDKIFEGISPTEVQRNAIEPIYENLVQLIQQRKFNEIVGEIKDSDSKLKGDLEKAGVILVSNSVDSQKLERISQLGPFLERSKEDEVIKVIMESWSIMAVEEETNLMFAGYPAGNDLDLLAGNYGNDFILKLDETVCFLLCEELAHAAQAGGKEDDRFVSEKMKGMSMPIAGYAKVRATELDAFLYMISKRLGPNIKQSTWLRMHQRIYGNIQNIANWLRVELTSDEKLFLE
ncbi:hypothetical protein A2V56_03795 [Candidatus Woesebacteria bacterium RBG_19FT_COMBO_42_9]|uniref:Uncharacterized protein n=1 Tax=Candidatus Woesebacteria bacterium RBG_16_42_24 TaxID=1802485 RepID=A0A1F7XKE9_9BACT|nr:MAG: hypothetical protein A2V97_00445 [Candidatus Woesebacteria bacterium RBG_16_42_24]OGM17589.1 MAG: hypothetical protein A2V56_03795 [Candidatus Woesebacteria bacterium RBG_19FT_COMBO_42_9]OGM67096.1 MAG: hypothetical protein A2985_02480 [Candidatus Woesebacteria bacterium RIFCSPLOWO2_01_FULL_43_11]